MGLWLNAASMPVTDRGRLGERCGRCETVMALMNLSIGATRSRPERQEFCGRELRGCSGARRDFRRLFELRSLLPQAGGDGSVGFVLKGIDNNDNAGWVVSDAGDVNGDGIDDLLIDAASADPNGQLFAGESYVVFGRTTSFPAAFELRSLFPQVGGDGSAGFILKGLDARDFSGYSGSDAGDVNGDGIDDLIIGAPFADPDDQSAAGESYVVFGRATAFPAAFELRSLFPQAGGDGSTGFILKGVDPDDASGYSGVSGAGDVNATASMT
jgi:hypothetical protein